MAVPTLSRDSAPGVWRTADLERGGLILLDTSALRAEDGYAFWSWAGRAPNPEEARERLLRLLDDPTLPTPYQEQLMEALMENQIPHTDTEKESVYHRLRREFIEEGRKEGRREGRQALLALAARLAPDKVAELRDIKDLGALEQAVEAAILSASRG